MDNEAFEPGTEKRLHKWGGRVFKSIAVLTWAGLVAVSVFLGAALLNYQEIAATLISPDQMAINRPSGGAKIVDRHGELLYEYVDDRDGLRQPVRLEDISPDFLAATIATEDASFFANPGVNLRGLARAGWENLSPVAADQGLFQGAGGSSITQQLVKNVYIPRDQRQNRSVDRKVREVVYALELTKRYDKDQILEWYVNQISYGGVYTGVEAASWGYFGKAAKDLTLGEAALLAGIPQSPASYDPRGNLEAALERRGQVLDLMARHSQLQIGSEAIYLTDPAQLEAARGTEVAVLPSNTPIQAPHFVLTYLAPQLEQVVGKDALLHDGLVITTTLDLNLQREAENILNKWIGDYEQISNAHNGAAILMKPDSAEILAMVGSRSYFDPEIDGEVNNALALNSPGSSFKPFVYLNSFIKLGWSPGTTIQDTPVTFRELSGSTFSPVNPDKKFHGTMTLRNALGNSMNVPAFKVAQQLGVPNIISFAKSMGMTGLTGQYGPAIAIGGVDLRPIDLTTGYGVLANGGVAAGQDTFAPERADESPISPIAILRIEDGDKRMVFNVDDHRVNRRVAPAEHVFMLSDVLSDPGAQCIIFGCGGLNIPGYKVAVKTGTSEPYDPKGPNAGKIGETWAFGYTPDWVVGVWAGNADNSPVVNIFSTTISFRAMRDILITAYNGAPQTPFVRPAGVITRSTCVNAPAQPQNQSAQPPPPNQPAPPAAPTQSCRSDLVVAPPPPPASAPRR